MLTLKWKCDKCSEELEQEYNLKQDLPICVCGYQLEQRHNWLVRRDAENVFIFCPKCNAVGVQKKQLEQQLAALDAQMKAECDAVVAAKQEP